MNTGPRRVIQRAAFALALLGLLGGIPAAAQEKRPAEQAKPPEPQLKPVLKPAPEAPASRAKLEIGLWGGFVRSRTLGSTSYRDSWTTLLGTSVVEKTSIDVRTRDIPFAGASAAYFFRPHTGVLLLAGFAQSRADGPAHMEFAWTLADGSVDERGSVLETAKGRMTTLPLSLDFVERFSIGRWRLELSAGPTCSFHRLDQESAFGYSVVKSVPAAGRPDLPPGESYDALAVPLKIPKTSWSSWGANAGAGVRFQATRLLTLALEARYFHSPDKTLSWTPQPGSYDGMFTANFPAEPVGEEDLADLAEAGRAFTLKVNPSFFQISLGVLFTFGR